MSSQNIIVKVTPTSFGSAVSFKKGFLYDRFYFLKDTTDYFRNIKKHKDINKNLIQKIEGMEIITKKYGINVIKYIIKSFNENKKYFELLDRLVKEKKWKLFSLLPLKFSVEIIDSCTNKCPWCYKDAKISNQPNEINPKIIYSVKDIISKFACHMAYSGGEPLLNKNIINYLSYKNDEVYDVITTSLVPDINLNRLIRAKVDMIQVSIHGPKHIHDKIIGIDGIWERIIQKMLYLGKFLNIATNIVISEENLYHLPELIKFIENNIFKKVNYKYTRIVLASPSGRGRKTIKPSNKLLVKEFLDLISNLEEKYWMLNFEIPAKHSNPLLYFEENEHLFCPAGTTGCEINVDGRIRPCNIFDESMSTNNSINNQNFFNIWINNNLFHKFRVGHKLGKCKDCSIKKYCVGECNYLLLNKKEILKCPYES